jgi:hypothetical protein
MAGFSRWAFQVFPPKFYQFVMCPVYIIILDKTLDPISMLRGVQVMKPHIVQFSSASL